MKRHRAEGNRLERIMTGQIDIEKEKEEREERLEQEFEQRRLEEALPKGDVSFNEDSIRKQFLKWLVESFEIEKLQGIELENVIELYNEEAKKEMMNSALMELKRSEPYREQEMVKVFKDREEDRVKAVIDEVMENVYVENTRNPNAEVVLDNIEEVKEKIEGIIWD